MTTTTAGMHAMGWKSVKDHYDIKHIVKTVGGDIHIGSPYIGDIIVISAEGVLTKRSSSASNSEIDRYQREMAADPETLRRLTLAEDIHDAAIPVYTWQGADVVLKHCDRLEWPNVTHDGEIMYENRFSQDRDVIIGWAKHDARSAESAYRRNLEEAEADVAKRRRLMDDAVEVRRLLEERHPGIPEEKDSA
jgi:hypothetical protein